MTSEEQRRAIAGRAPAWLKLGALAGPPANFGVAETTGAARSLTQLNHQVHRVRAELARLRQELGQAQDELALAQGARVRLAGEQLALAAGRAKAIADSAHGSVGALARAAADDGAHEAVLCVEPPTHAALREDKADVEGERARQIAFLAMVAHELRNPLLPLRLAAQMLTLARTDEARFAALQATIAGQVAHMGRLIGDLLDGSRVGTGKFRMERSDIDLAGPIATALETVRPAMAERQQQLTYTGPGRPLHVHADPMRLVQVIVNLLDNASKYTPHGGAITLGVAACGEMAEITIADNGIGMAAEALPHVFELFVRDEHAIATGHDGLGVGLAVVRDLVHAHGGSVTASSAGRGHGSSFVVLLPLLPRGSC